MAERCELTDLLVTDCAHCRGIKAPDEEEVAMNRDFDRWLDALR